MSSSHAITLSRYLLFLLVLFSVGSTFSSCSLTKNIPEDQFLLEYNAIRVKNTPQDIHQSDLKRYILQKPNPRILGIPFSLYVYNWAKPNAEKGFNGWLRRIGSAPVIHNEYLSEKSVNNLTTYLQSRGFYQCQVTKETINQRPKRKKVFYNVHLGEPTLIDSLHLQVQDPKIAEYLKTTWETRAIKEGQRLDIVRLKHEAKRLETALKNQGFYHFSAEYIGFTADTLNKKNRATVVFHIPAQNNALIPPKAFRQYYVQDLSVNTQFNPLQNTNDSNQLQHTTHNHIHYLYPHKPPIRFKTLSPMILLNQDSLLRKNLIDKTQENILSMGLYQQASLQFQEIPHATPDSTNRFPTKGNITLVQRKLQGYKGEILLTNSGAFGVQGGVSYFHRNLFKGSELFEISLQGQIEALKKREQFKFNSAKEIGVSVSLRVPRFVFPYAPQKFLLIYEPSTLYKISFNYQKRPDFSRSLLQTSTAFQWQFINPSFSTLHTITPASLSIVKIHHIDSLFQAHINKTFLAYSYLSQLITTTSYTFFYSQKQTPSRRQIFSSHFHIELAGNVFAIAFHALNKTQQRPFTIASLPFAQYIKTNLNLTYLIALSQKTALALRLFGGVAFPYGNSQTIPFEKRYYQGGANGVRAWHARDLGPGSYHETELQFPNQTSDIKLEANVEYRFNIYKKFEGAIFLDAGNIWAITKYDEREGARFSPNFYKQIALGYGAGLRYNLGFFILRFDLGIKLHDPAIQTDDEGNLLSHWIPRNGAYTQNDFVLNFGVGFPF